MDSQSLKMFTIAAAGVATLAVASDARACEDCRSDPNNQPGGGICWSGFSSGYGSCWGGQAPNTWCQTATGDCSMDPNVQLCPGDPGYMGYAYCDDQSWQDYFCAEWGWFCS
jgi:hypothetical protein